MQDFLHVNEIPFPLEQDVEPFMLVNLSMCGRCAGIPHKITFEIDGYGPGAIAEIYIANKYELNSRSGDCMIQIAIKYHRYVHVPDGFLFTDKQMDIYMKYATRDSIITHHETIMDSIKNIEGVSYLVEYDTINKKIIKKYSNKFDSFMKRVLKLTPDVDFSQGEPGILKIHVVHSYGYYSGMRKVSTEDEFKKILEQCEESGQEPRDLYINCNIDVKLLDIISIGNISPEVFANWRIGPKCLSISHLFEDYPYEPHIYNWIVSEILWMHGTFKSNGVRDLSMLNFGLCCHAIETFMNSTIEKAPKFCALVCASDMFDGCSKLCDVSKVETEILVDRTRIFKGCPLMRLIIVEP